MIGQMEAWTVNSESVLPPGRKTRALLAIVVLSAPRPVLRSRLAELLWSRRPEEQARASLRQEIHRLLEVLAPAGQEILTITRDSLALRPGVVWVDVDEVLRATTTHPGALALLDSELLEELDGVDPAFDVWLHGERERLRDRARSVAEALLNEQVAPEALIPVAQQLLAIDRAHEGAWRALMRAHAERGERGLAIQSYDRCRAVLADMLDAVPSPETQALLAEIRSGKAVRPVTPPAPAPPERRPELSLSARIGPRIGVLPLTLMGTEETENHLALGLAEEITAALSRFRWLSLVSTSSITQFIQETRDDTALRRVLGLDYLLDGTVQRAGKRLRITPRLVDLRDGSQVVWTRRFDRLVEDLLTLQDEVAAESVAQIDPELLRLESRRAALVPAQEATAYDLMLRALPGMTRSDHASFVAAGGWLRNSMDKQPDYAPAHGWYAYWLHFLVEYGWADDVETAIDAASRHAERAITLDPQHGRGFAIAGHIRALLQRRHPEAMSLHERALALNPNLGMAWALSGFAHLYAGDRAEAERRFNRYKQLSPADPFAFQFDLGFSVIAVLNGEYAKAASLGRAVSELNPDFPAAAKPYLAALGYLGEAREAADVRHRLMRVEPGFNVRRFVESSPYSVREDTEALAAGLRLAGIPEGEPARAASGD
ncbi:MAG TPA: BTAD domain-containing putative transcriptional regulator [Acetobacteraceae bacterium]|nr:BTAD domain-containing putative transcriptional regulator [Acetobacteraceae bacterium]